AASQNLALAARYHGLAMVMYTHFSQEKLKQLLDVPFEWDVDGVMGLGFPDLSRINPRVLEASLIRVSLGALGSSERHGDPATKGGRPIHGAATHVIRGGPAAQNMWLMAHGLGLGTSLVTHWIEEKVKVLIDCPRDWDLVGVMPLGVPAESPARRRRQLDELAFQDVFGHPWRP